MRFMLRTLSGLDSAEEGFPVCSILPIYFRFFDLLASEQFYVRADDQRGFEDRLLDDSVCTCLCDAKYISIHLPGFPLSPIARFLLPPSLESAFFISASQLASRQIEQSILDSSPFSRRTLYSFRTRTLLEPTRTTMGGCLWLTPVRANRREEIEESPLFDTSGDDEPSNNSWSYRYSAFGWLKGYALRAGIQFLESIQKQVDERKSAGPVDGSRQFLSDAGILAAATSPTDAKALGDASAAIPAAICLLRTWIREPELDQWGHPAIISSSALSGGIQQASVPVPAPPGDAADTDRDAAGEALDAMLNSNYRVGELARHEMCPPALHRVGLGGLFVFAKMWDNNQFVYPHDARVVAASFARVMEFLDPEWRETAGELRELLKRCGEDERSMIQG